MILSKPQQAVSADPCRFRVVAAGRRFGKTFLAINEMAKFARYPNRKILAIANTYRQVKNTVWDELKDQLYSRNWVKRVNESDLQIELINGSRIYLRSADNKEALRGTKYDFISLDECADMHPDTWFTVLRPTLSDTGGHALFIGSPKGRNWFYDLWLQSQTLDDWSSYQFTTLEGGYVSEDEIAAAKRDLGEREFQQEYEAQFVNYSGVVFYAFTDKNVVKRENVITAQTPIHIGGDFNVDPMSAVVCVRDANTLHVFDEIEIYGSDTAEMAKEIRNRYGHNRPIHFYPDSSGQKRTTNSPGLTDHIILKNAGFILHADPTNPPVAETIGTVNSLLRSKDGNMRLTIDPKCKKLIECLNKLVYKEGTRIVEKGAYDHMTDALRYVCHKTFPLKPIVGNSFAPRRMNTGRMLS